MEFIGGGSGCGNLVPIAFMALTSWRQCLSIDLSLVEVLVAKPGTTTGLVVNGAATMAVGRLVPVNG